MDSNEILERVADAFAEATTEWICFDGEPTIIRDKPPTDFDDEGLPTCCWVADIDCGPYRLVRVQSGLWQLMADVGR